MSPLIQLALFKKYLTKGSGKHFDTAMLIYRHWEIMANSKKLSDIISL